MRRFRTKIQDSGSGLGFKGKYSRKLVPNHQIVKRTEKDNQMRMRMKKKLINTTKDRKLETYQLNKHVN